LLTFLRLHCYKNQEKTKLDTFRLLLLLQKNVALGKFLAKFHPSSWPKNQPFKLLKLAGSKTGQQKRHQKWQAKTAETDWGRQSENVPGCGQGQVVEMEETGDLVFYAFGSPSPLNGMDISLCENRPSNDLYRSIVKCHTPTIFGLRNRPKLWRWRFSKLVQKWPRPQKWPSKTAQTDWGRRSKNAAFSVRDAVKVRSSTGRKPMILYPLA